MMKFIVFISTLLIYSACFGYGNYQALEITNIKPSGSGTPATTQYNRIYRAYPGIDYRVPVGVIGGQFPYTFTLSNAPTGMAVNTNGVITWTNPQTSASNITIRAIDVDGDYVEATWSITVGTDGFIFINDTSEPGGDGTISSPYDSISDVLALEDSAVNSIIYFREGTYSVPMHNGFRTSPGTYGCNVINRAHIWIGYPGESVALTMGGVNAAYAWWFETHNAVATQPECWFENITFQSPREWGFRHSAGGHYLTFFNTTMDDLVGSNIANNCGGLFNQGYGNIFYTYIVDSTFSNFDTAHGVGSIYDSFKTLIERNDFNNHLGLGSAIAIKLDCQYTTIRKNIIINVTSAFAHTNNGLWHGCEYNEICYNYTNSPTGRWNIEPPPDSNTLTTWFYRNTIDGTVEFVNLDSPDGCEGPWHFENNVFQNAYSATDGIYFNTTSGVPGAGTADGYLCINGLDTNFSGASGLVDVNGNLTEAYSEYIGMVGWQLAQTPASRTRPKIGSTPIKFTGGNVIAFGSE